MPLIATEHSSGAKKVICTHCGGASEAAQRAMSVFCPHCHKRVILEDFKIRTYHGVIEFATCGDIIVERKGFVVAPIKVHDLTIKGKVHGRVTARGQVKVCKNGQLRGDVHAPSLVVESGATIDGFLRIGATNSD